MSNIKEVPAFKADWPGTVHPTYEEARQANIDYLIKRIFGVDEGSDDAVERIDAAGKLMYIIKADRRRQVVKNLLEALIKEL